MAGRVAQETAEKAKITSKHRHRRERVRAPHRPTNAEYTAAILKHQQQKAGRGSWGSLSEGEITCASLVFGGVVVAVGQVFGRRIGVHQEQLALQRRT